MADEKPTQKKISHRYDGAADYLRHPHYFRRLRGWVFLATAAVSILGAVTFSFWGKQEAYSPGPISQNHARFAHDCRVCHLDTDRTAAALALADSPHSLMDAACLTCHSATRLHLPQAASFGVRAVSSQLTVVHATGCATCHREHVGRDRMALPSQQTCIACHGSTDELKRARRTVTLPHPAALAATGENRDLGDGVVRFLAPARPPGTLAAFASYDKGHPPFTHDQPGLRDPAVLKYNHERHLRSDLPQVGGHRLDCADCHRAGAGGAFMQPVKYAQHCAPCHTLQFQPSLPALRIPHGDAEKVRYFLASREVSFKLALQAEGVAPAELDQRVQLEMQALARRVSGSLSDLERRVFFEGDPPGEKGERVASAGHPKFLTECAKCHAVAPGDASHAPRVQPPGIAERWVQHGPFTHLPHQHMSCFDCHAAAQKSTATSDILLPPQTLCAECHRAPTATAEAAAPRGDTHTLAATQRAHGGVKWDCTACHGFHAPADAQAILMPSKPSASATKTD